MTTEVNLPDLHLQGVSNRSDEFLSDHHESVVSVRDGTTGLRAIIAIHDTALGPALGGTRFMSYATESDAVTDVLRLSRGMTDKAAAADMPFGGGKAVIVGDPARVKTPDLLMAYGRFVDTLGGRYITAADVGTTSADLDVVARSTKWVVGRSRNAGSSGDSGFATAYGVVWAMEAAARARWGTAELHGRTIGVEGVGKVGSQLVQLLLDRRAEVVVSDVHSASLADVRRSHPAVRTTDRMISEDLDVYAPCALGGTLTPQSIRSLRAEVVCGAANNQLLTDEVDDLLTARGVLWVPDFLANAGGLIQVGSEFEQRSWTEVLGKVEGIGATVTSVLNAAAATKVSPGEAAKNMVRRRLAEARARSAIREVRSEVEAPV